MVTPRSPAGTRTSYTLNDPDRPPIQSLEGRQARYVASLAGTALAEFEYGPVAGAQLPDVAGYSSSYHVAGALGLNV